MKVLGLVVARGGSKGVPRKNIRKLAGKPLLTYTAECAAKAQSLSRVVLSTEDAEIADVGKQAGLEVPFTRPAELARDDTPAFPVIRHAVEWLAKNGDPYDAVCLLQPTDPLRRPEDVDGCVDLLKTSGADCVISVLPVPLDYNPHWVYLRGDDGSLRLSTGEKQPIPRRQSLPPAFCRSGSVYAFKTDVVLRGDNIYGDRVMGYPVDPERTSNIDTLDDWERAERLLSK